MVGYGEFPLCRWQSRIRLRMQLKEGDPIAGELLLRSQMLKDTGRWNFDACD